MKITGYATCQTIFEKIDFYKGWAAKGRLKHVTTACGVYNLYLTENKLESEREGQSQEQFRKYLCYSSRNYSKSYAL